MISRNLSQRLKRLEARVMPTGERIVIRIVYVDPERGETGSHLVTIDPHVHDQGARGHTTATDNVG